MKESLEAVVPATVNFTVHPAILDSIISKQSGTLHKAMAELIMNSIDACASKVEVTLDDHSFVVSDNGKGFESREEILTCFAEFGTPQSKEKVFGRFRIGRGQCFVWGKVTWRSGPYRMVVDTKHKGLQFEFHENESFIEGCVVSGELYAPLESYNLNSELRELKHMAEYVETDLFVNGEKINIKPSEKSWMYETDDAYIDIDSSRFGWLSTYNQGVFCFNFDLGALGLAGTVVSKQPLTVNFARNQIMMNECQVWRRIEKHLKDVGVNKLLGKRYLSAGEQEAIVDRFLTGEFSYLQIRECPILTDVAGVNFSFATLLRSKAVTVMSDDASSLSDQVHASKLARVLTLKTLKRFGCRDVFSLYLIFMSAIEKAQKTDSLKSRLANMLEADSMAAARLTWIEDVKEYAPSFDNGFSVVDDKKLKPIEMMALNALRRGNQYVCRVLAEADIETWVKPRKIYAGESDSEAWTDGISYICIDRKHLKACHKGPDRFLYAVQLLVHEYLHECQDNQRHYHDELFHEDFHRAILNVKMKGSCTRDLYSVATTIASYYADALFKANIPIPESFAQFGGAAKDVFSKQKDKLRRTERELKQFKMASPLVDDPDRLCFHKMTAGGKEICFNMSCAGPYMLIKGNEDRFGGDRQLLVEERLRLSSSGKPDAKGFYSFLLEGSYKGRRSIERTFYLSLDASTEEATALANVLDAYLSLGRDVSQEQLAAQLAARDLNTHDEAFYHSELFLKHLSAWAEKEPELAKYCAQGPLSCKAWYQITRMHTLLGEIEE